MSRSTTGIRQNNQHARYLLAALCLLLMFPGIHNPAAAESSAWTGSEIGAGHIAVSEPAPNYPFLSDLMRKAWENWLDNTGATLIGYEEPTIQTYGYRMPLKYRIGSEEVTVCWYIDAHDRIYDVGEDITGFAFRGPEAIERIVSRML